MCNLNLEFKLTKDQISFYKSNNFIKIKNVLSEAVINNYNEIISKKVDSLNIQKIELNKRDTYGKAFLQLFNLWQKDKKIKELVFSKRLASIARQLMQVKGVRLYHDQALFKEAGGGITPWHADQYYWPLSSEKTITAWIPLQKVTLNMGPLEFSAGSQKIIYGRELSISDESEIKIDKKLRLTDYNHVVEPFDVGEISFHSGWIFHRAGENSSKEIRKVMTIIYMDDNMKLKKPENKGQENDWKTWCPGARIGEKIDTPLNPVLI